VLGVGIINRPDILFQFRAFQQRTTVSIVATAVVKNKLFCVDVEISTREAATGSPPFLDIRLQAVARSAGFRWHWDSGWFWADPDGRCHGNKRAVHQSLPGWALVPRYSSGIIGRACILWIWFSG